MSELKSPLRTIREYCLDCANGSPTEVKLCPVVNCKLYPYRFGKNPNRPVREYSDEEREIMRKRMAENLGRSDSREDSASGQISGDDDDEAEDEE